MTHLAKASMHMSNKQPRSVPENRFKHLGNIIVTRPVLLRLRTLLRSLKEGLAPVCLDRWALGEVPAEIDSFLMPRVHSGKRFGGAGVHRQHLHDCLTFIPTPSLQCVALLAKFQLKCHEMFAHQAMRYGNEKIGTCIDQSVEPEPRR